MSDPRSRTRAQEEAAEWLARLGNHAVSTDLVREFRDWRDDPANDAAYEEAEAFWDASGQHAADPGILKMTQDALDRGRRTSGWRTWVGGWRLGGALTLAGLTLVAGTVLAFDRINPTYATQPIEQKVVRLADGSRVHLNVDSAVRVRFSKGQRTLQLKRGEAFFEVAHDAARPFIVEAGDARIRALGTKFDVHRNAGGGVEVTLLQGSVQVTPDKARAPVMLAPNQRALVARTGPIRKTAADATRETSWTSGRLVFRDTPLAAAIAEVNRYSASKVELSGAGLADRPVSGFFDVGDSESFARGVADLFDLSLTRGDDGAWRLAPPGA